MLDPSTFFLAFVGEGGYKETLIQKAKEMGLDSNAYCFFPRIGKRSIPTLLEHSDASYVAAIRNEMFRFGIGMNKLMDAMMGEKPVLYAVDAPNNWIEEYDCGISVEAENAKALSKGFCELMQLPKERRAQMGTNGKNAMQEFFLYPHLAKQFLEGITGSK